MKVITLQGSPRKNGNTAKVLGWVEDELRSMGHEVESIYLNAKDIKGCLACGKCKEEPEKIGCVQKDDAHEIFEKMANAQLAIFASPLYFWGFTAQIKALIDRTYCLYSYFHEPNHTSLLEGQRQALLVTGAGPYENNAEGVFAAFDRMQNPYMTQKAGELFIGKCTTADEMDASVKDQASEFARQIVS